jgi:hypothetical protein
MVHVGGYSQIGLLRKNPDHGWLGQCADASTDQLESKGLCALR